jgi:hypothetical protein
MHFPLKSTLNPMLFEDGLNRVSSLQDESHGWLVVSGQT